LQWTTTRGAAPAGPRYARDRPTTKITTPSPKRSPQGSLTRPKRDRGHKFVVAIVTRPGVPDASRKVECGFLGNQQHATAARALGSAKIAGRKALGVAAMDAHRRSPRRSLTHPRSGLIRPRWCPRSVALLRRLRETLVACAERENIRFQNTARAAHRKKALARHQRQQIRARLQCDGLAQKRQSSAMIEQERQASAMIGQKGQSSAMIGSQLRERREACAFF
jgi:hypothetical protein